jgi:hypothetical protein
MLRRVTPVRTEVSEESIASIIIDVDHSSPNFVTLMMEALHSSETRILTRATRRNIPEDDIIHSQGRESLKS